MRRSSMGSRAASAAVAVVAATAVSVVAPTPALAQSFYNSYVALGDSFVAGPGIPPQGSGPECGRSAVNYPSLVADAIGVGDFVDASCGGAVSEDLRGTQISVVTRADIAPQYDALRPDTDLVTVGIGGNDIGLVQLAISCINSAAPPQGVSCAEDNPDRPDPYDAAIDAFAPTYTTIVEEIRARSPHADILFVGYPTGIRDGGCFPEQQMWPQDATYLQSKIDRLNTVMAQQVGAAGAEFVDLRTSTIGHDSCATPDERWMEGIVPTSPGIPLHPNAAGHRNAAEQVVGALSAND
ncbi:SGNH/GDSL hydrolase family protein [Rhodococcus artemisiae]|uniref:SGNH/GDSL hydrolase family protein n=1 Tax=Rhodococcus artemisiae TaxID=714159 RepID=A0ABU7L5N6_9NOCA|nr:SGNH/GDSL hydrolase family protein [Rhodococcus artemisiae]MEE2056662.1 SGNH/GDSL hydrolase family protein [Rhodococcus artemisiae]